MKMFWTCLLVQLAVLAQFHLPTSNDPVETHPTIADFGLAYPLSTDWVRTTGRLRSSIESSHQPLDFDVLLAAVYVPGSNFSESNPSFSLRAYRQPATDCKKNLQAMIANSREKDTKDWPEGGLQEFSAMGRDYFRVNLAQGVGGRDIICTSAKGHLLIWVADAPDEKGLDMISATLSSITPLAPTGNEESEQSAGQKNGNAEETGSQSVTARPEKVRVSSGVMTGLLIKKVAPIYPADARAAHIQGTVVLVGEISKAGDITDLEFVGGPIELAGSAVAAVRQWKYKPYLLMGQPVTVLSTIQVNYLLRP